MQDNDNIELPMNADILPEVTDEPMPNAEAKQEKTTSTRRAKSDKNEKNEIREEANLRRKVIGCFLFPIAVFPLLALVTYDWRAIPSLHIPAITPTGNLIGVVGDYFAYYGYSAFGLGVWIVPAICIFVGALLVMDKDIHPGRRTLWLSVFMVSFCCLMQLFSGVPAVESILHSINIGNNAGGAIGFLAMNRCLSSLISPFGAGILMISLMLISLVLAIGIRNLRNAVWRVIAWVTGDDADEHPGETRAERKARKAAEKAQAKAEREEQLRLAAEAARAAAEEAQREKERIAAEKSAAEAAKRAEDDYQRQLEEQKRLEEARKAAQIASDQANDLRAQLAAIQQAKAAAAAENNRPAPAPIAAAPAAAATTPATPQTAEEPVDKGPYMIPADNLLQAVPPDSASGNDVDSLKEIIVSTLKTYGVDVTVTEAIQGPTVTQFAVAPAVGVTYNNIISRQKELQGALMVETLRVFAPIPGKNAAGVEIPNKTPSPVHFRSVIESPTWQAASKKMQLPLLLGRDISGHEQVADLAKLPHLLVAGATGKGKSVCLNSIICGLLMCRTPDQLKFIMVDPKRVEFTGYNKLPHLLIPVVNENAKVVFALRWAVQEMGNRLKLFQKANVRNIVAYNERPQQSDLFVADSSDELPKTVPYIVIIVDEVADIMQTSGKEVEPLIARLAALARATGIHLILATQRPDTKVITGTIKGNIPGRIAFKTSSSIDSRTILDTTGAEQLIGNGDMLYKQADGNLIRAQGSWIKDGDINAILKFIEEHSNTQFDDKLTKRIGKIKEEESDVLDDPEDEENQENTGNGAAMPDMSTMTGSGSLRPAGMNDSKEEQLYNQALEVVRVTKRASTSHLQRRMGIGYNHAARLMDLLQDRGIIGPAKGGAAVREILVDLDQMLGIGAPTQPTPIEPAADPSAIPSPTTNDNNEEQTWTSEQPSEPPANQSI